MIFLVKGLDDYMLPCLNKKYFGFECMGCGLQRSIALMLKGQFADSFLMYPGLYTLFILIGFVAINAIKNFKNANKIITILAILNVVTIIGSYFLKLYLK